MRKKGLVLLTSALLTMAALAMPVTAGAADAQIRSLRTAGNTAISIGSTPVVNLGEEAYQFTFTAPSDGRYLMYVDYDFTPAAVCVYEGEDEDSELSPYGYNAEQFMLQGGKTYRIHISAGETIASANFIVAKAPAISKIEVAPDKTVFKANADTYVAENAVVTITYGDGSQAQHKMSQGIFREKYGAWVEYYIVPPQGEPYSFWDALPVGKYQVFFECAGVQSNWYEIEATAEGAPAHVHQWSEWAVVVSPTVTVPGVMERTCSCGKKETMDMAMLLPSVGVEGVSANMPMKLKDSVKLKVRLAPGDAVEKWESSNKKAVTVSKNGTLKAKAVGKSTITLTTKAGAVESFRVTVQKGAVKTKKLQVFCEKKVELKKGGKLQLVTMVTPATSKQKVTFKSSNKKAVTVSSKGKVKAVKKGRATITVQSGSKKVKITVTVK